MNNSNRIFNLGFLATALLTATVAVASSPAVPITSNAFPGKTYSIQVIQNAQGEIESMVYATDSGSKTLTIPALQSQRQLLYPDHNAMYLSAEQDFSAQKGGHIDLQFLTSVMSGKYKSFRILVDVIGDSVSLRSDPNLEDKSSDKNPYTGPFSAIYIKKGTLGISSITPSEN